MGDKTAAKWLRDRGRSYFDDATTIELDAELATVTLTMAEAYRTIAHELYAAADKLEQADQ